MQAWQATQLNCGVVYLGVPAQQVLFLLLPNLALFMTLPLPYHIDTPLPLPLEYPISLVGGRG